MMRLCHFLASIRATTAALLLGSFLVVVGFVVPAMQTGCAGKGQYNPVTQVYDTNAPASQVVVAAEGLRATALEVFDAFMQIERSHEEEFRKIDPKIHEFAETVRRDGAKWLNDMTDAKVAYQSARTPDKLSALNSTLAALNVAVARANKYLLPQGGK